MPGVVLLLTFFYLPIHYFIKSYGNQLQGLFFKHGIRQSLSAVFFYLKINLEITGTIIYLWHKYSTMAKKKANPQDNFESVKLRKAIVNKVRKNKNETGVPIATFFEMAAEEKLNKQSKK